jgi:hypothetical protein
VDERVPVSCSECGRPLRRLESRRRGRGDECERKRTGHRPPRPRTRRVVQTGPALPGMDDGQDQEVIEP